MIIVIINNNNNNNNDAHKEQTDNKVASYCNNEAH